MTLNDVSAGSDAKAYYSASDSGQSVRYFAHGLGAERLGLAREISTAELHSLFDKKHPTTGQFLGQRQRDDGRAAKDATWSVPKSVSVAMLMDPRIEPMVLESINRTMQRMERRAQVRVRRLLKRDADENRTAGNLLWVNIPHQESRPVGGKTDPNWHCHTLIFNCCHDPVENRWKASQLGDLKKEAPFWQAAWHAEMASGLHRLGYRTRRTKDAFEVEGVSDAIIQKFSRRTAQIEQEHARRQQALSEQIKACRDPVQLRKLEQKLLRVKSPKAKAALGAQIREKKLAEAKADKQFEEWLKRLTPAEYRTLGSVTSRIQDAMKDEIPLGPDLTFPGGKFGKALRSLGEAILEREVREAATTPEDASMPLQRTLAGMLEEMSAVPEEKLLTEALKQHVGAVTLEGLQAEVEAGDFARAKIGDTAYVTTREAMATERDLRTFALQETDPLIPADTRLNWSVPDDPLQRAAELTPAEKASCEHVLRSPTKMTLLRTKKGKERAAVESMVKRGLERSGNTVAQLDAATLDGESLKRQEKVDVLIVSGSEQLKFGDAVRLSQLPNSPRIILSGALRDYRKPERGQVMTMLEDIGGLKSNQEPPRAKLADKVARVSQAWAGKIERAVRGMHRWNTLEQHRERQNAVGTGSPQKHRERQLER